MGSCDSTQMASGPLELLRLRMASSQICRLHSAEEGVWDRRKAAHTRDTIGAQPPHVECMTPIARSSRGPIVGPIESSHPAATRPSHTSKQSTREP
jgi:hypothetical protein